MNAAAGDGEGLRTNNHKRTREQESAATRFNLVLAATRTALSKLAARGLLCSLSSAVTVVRGRLERKEHTEANARAQHTAIALQRTHRSAGPKLCKGGGVRYSRDERRFGRIHCEMHLLYN